MGEAKTIKDSGELVDGIGVMVKFGKKVSADGKVDFNDFPHLVELGQKSAVLSAAIEGMQNIPAEIKDLNLAEAQALLTKIFAAAAGAA